jgi:putative sterol carrier protein
VSDVAEVFAKLPEAYGQGKKVEVPRVFYFSLGEEEKWTVTLRPDKCEVARGKPENADCFFKSSTQLFLDIWARTHTPSPMDFLTGAIKSDNPMLLKEFIGAFLAEA